MGSYARAHAQKYQDKMTLLQLLALIKDDMCVVLVDPNDICERILRECSGSNRAIVARGYPSDAWWTDSEKHRAISLDKVLALVYLKGGGSEKVKQTADFVGRSGGRAIVLACNCNWSQLPEGVEAMRSRCSGRDVFEVVLHCLRDNSGLRR